MQTNVIQPSFCPLAFFFSWVFFHRERKEGKKVTARLAVSNFFPLPSLLIPSVFLPLSPPLCSLCCLSLGFLLLFSSPWSLSIPPACLSSSLPPTPPLYLSSPLLFLPALSLSLWEISLKHVVTSTCPQGWKISPGHLSNLFGKLFQASLPSLYPLPHHLTSISPSPLTIWFMTYQKNRLSILPGLKHCIRKRNAD